jgi:hypothetical protein
MQNKEIGRSWDGGGEQGVHGLAPGHFIGSGRAFPSSPRRQWSRSGGIMFALIEHKSYCSDWQGMRKGLWQWGGSQRLQRWSASAAGMWSLPIALSGMRDRGWRRLCLRPNRAKGYTGWEASGLASWAAVRWPLSPIFFCILFLFFFYF